MAVLRKTIIVDRPKKTDNTAITAGPRLWSPPGAGMSTPSIVAISQEARQLRYVMAASPNLEERWKVRSSRLQSTEVMDGYYVDKRLSLIV